VLGDRLGRDVALEGLGADLGPGEAGERLEALEAAAARQASAGIWESWSVLMP
jgi:hypothetical protein